MINKEIALIILFIFFNLNLNGQVKKYSIGIGYGDYSMHHLKERLIEQNESLDFHAKIMNNFPGFPYFHAAYSRDHVDHGYSLRVTLNSTVSFSDKQEGNINAIIISFTSVFMFAGSPIIGATVE